MEPVIAKAALYCRDLIFSEERIVKSLIINSIAIIEMSPNKTFVNS